MIKIGNAPCSWGVLEFGLSGDAAGYAEILDELMQTGYTGTELGDWGFMPTDPTRLKSELSARGLSLIGAFVPVDFKDAGAHEAGEDAAVRTARLLAGVQGDLPFMVLADDNGKDPIRTMNAGRIQPDQGLDNREWFVFAEGVQRVAAAVLRETGLRTVFHHHCGGYVETQGEVDTLLGLIDPALLGLCFDTGHYRFGGGDPLTGLRRHVDRIWHVHFKDCEPEIANASRSKGWDYFTSVRQGIFCELGNGDIDFEAIRSELQTRGYSGWIVVEQDVLPGMGTPKESAERNRQYLKRTGL